MPRLNHVDPAHRLVVTTLSGTMSDADLSAHGAALPPTP